MYNYYEPGKWWTCLYNTVPAVRNAMSIPAKVDIQDTTLRDGEQTPGLVFSVDEKVRIAEMLNDIGVERIEAGMVAVSEADREAIKRIVRMPNRFKYIGALCRAKKEDIDMAEDCGANNIIIECPISVPKLKYQYNWTIDKAIDITIPAIEYAKSKGFNVSLSSFDTTRADQDELEKYLTTIMKTCRPDSVTILDTMGSALPEAIAYMVRWIKDMCDGISVEVHTHNDFGMGTATEIAGICAGADVVHTCINGLGDRMGNAALEEVAFAMKVLLGLDNDYNLLALEPACKYVAELTGRPLPVNKPVIGVTNYSREAGMGANLAVENPLVMFATDPSIIGRKGRVILGKKSGKANVEYLLKQNGWTADKDQIAAMVQDIKTMAVAKKRILTDDEFKQIAGKYIKVD